MLNGWHYGYAYRQSLFFTSGRSPSGELAVDFLKLFGKPLILNDSSLKLGGLYDIKGYWTPSHEGHRKGIVVDINNFTERDFDFEALVADHNATAKWEEDPPHYHIRLLNNRDE